MVAFWLLTMVSDHNDIFWLDVLAAIVFVMALGLEATSLYVRYVARRHGSSERALLDREDLDHYAVEVTIVIEGKAIGADRGVIWFADGVMGFSGASTAFVLAAGDVSADWIGRRKAKWDRTFEKPKLTLKGTPQPTIIEIEPLVRKGASFEERLASFYVAKERPLEERQWPPLRSYIEEHQALEQAVGR